MLRENMVGVGVGTLRGLEGRGSGRSRTLKSKPLQWTPVIPRLM